MTQDDTTARSRDSSTTVPVEYVESFFGACRGNADLADCFVEANASWVREDSRWEEQETEPGVWEFDRWDRIVSAFGERDVEILPILDYTAPWASTADPDATGRERDHSPAADIDDWRNYVETFVERYPQIEYFEVWNEPNLEHFLFTDEPQHVTYVERILEPAAEVLHDAGKKVVAPTFTTEWPAEAYPDGTRPSEVKWSVDANTTAIDRWLGYKDAWEHVDYLSVHYTKGDTEKHELPHADDMMAFYQWVRDNYIEPGKLDGIWNTEEGHTATGAGDSGYVALEPWEREPFEQWVPRYTVPVLHWALDTGWDQRDQFKVFWYAMSHSRGALEPHNVVETTDDGTVRLSDTGRVLRTTVSTLTDAERVGVYPETAEVGFGLFSVQPGGPRETAGGPPYEFTSYAFTLDDDLLVAAWLDLPGIELARHQSEESKIQARIEGLDPSIDYTVRTVDFRTGESSRVHTTEWTDEGTFRVRIPRTDDPVLYLRID